MCCFFCFFCFFRSVADKNQIECMFEEMSKEWKISGNLGEINFFLVLCMASTALSTKFPSILSFSIASNDKRNKALKEWQASYPWPMQFVQRISSTKMCSFSIYPPQFSNHHHHRPTDARRHAGVPECVGSSRVNALVRRYSHPARRSGWSYLMLMMKYH